MNLDIGAIFFAALVGGVFGGIGGYLGFLIGKRFPAHAKPITQICTTVGVVIALASTDAIKSALFGQSANQANVTNIDTGLQSNALFQMVKQDWPSEYQAFLDQLGATTAQAEAEALAASFMVGLRRNNARYVQSADDATLVEAMTSNMNLSRVIKEREGEAFCNAFALKGVVALGDKTSAYTMHLEDVALANLKVLTSGRDRATDRSATSAPPLAEDDLESFEQFVLSRGGEPGLRDRAANPNNPELCSDVLAVMEAAVEFERNEPRGRALRAAMIYGIVTN